MMSLIQVDKYLERTHYQVETFYINNKVEGFVHESIRIEHFEIFGLTNRIHKINLLKRGLQNESTN